MASRTNKAMALLGHSQRDGEDSPIRSLMPLAPTMLVTQVHPDEARARLGLLAAECLLQLDKALDALGVRDEFEKLAEGSIGVEHLSPMATGILSDAWESLGSTRRRAEQQIEMGVVQQTQDRTGFNVFQLRQAQEPTRPNILGRAVSMKDGIHAFAIALAALPRRRIKSLERSLKGQNLALHEMAVVLRALPKAEREEASKVMAKHSFGRLAAYPLREAVQIAEVLPREILAENPLRITKENLDALRRKSELLARVNSLPEDGVHLGEGLSPEAIQKLTLKEAVSIYEDLKAARHQAASAPYRLSTQKGREVKSDQELRNRLESLGTSVVPEDMGELTWLPCYVVADFVQEYENRINSLVAQAALKKATAFIEDGIRSGKRKINLLGPYFFSSHEPASLRLWVKGFVDLPSEIQCRINNVTNAKYQDMLPREGLKEHFARRGWGVTFSTDACAHLARHEE